MNNENEFLNWGDSFVAQENEFVVLPEGEYQVTVTGIERKIMTEIVTRFQMEHLTQN